VSEAGARGAVTDAGAGAQPGTGDGRAGAGPGREGLARRRLQGLLSGTWLAQACYAVTKLGVPDLLAGGPRTAADLARSTGADPGTLYRLLRALASAGVFRPAAPGAFALNPVSELLRSDAPGSARELVLLQGEEVFRSFAEIMYTVRSGAPAFENVHGQPFYSYLDGHPAAARVFTESMGGQQVPAALSTCDFSGVRRVVDVGGGNAALLIEVLSARPGLRAILLERPEAVSRARARLAAAGLAGRADVVEGSFFEQVPAGGDAYVLCRVLHNWTDEHAAQILHRVHDAMCPGGRLFVLEEFLPDPADPGSGQGPVPAAAGLVDLLMLVTLEGRDRTAAEYTDLVAMAGFHQIAVRRAAAAHSSGVLEATRT
jgi:hypothetical protein